MSGPEPEPGTALMWLQDPEQHQQQNHGQGDAEQPEDDGHGDLLEIKE